MSCYECDLFVYLGYRRKIENNINAGGGMSEFDHV